MLNRPGNECSLTLHYKSEIINAVLHTNFDLSNSTITVIVPGIFGDRCDSRAMFTRIARALSMNGFSVLRFDFVGGGSNLGCYAENDIESFVDQLNEITSEFMEAFGFVKRIIYVGFSEGLKFAYHVAAKRDDVSGIISCNGLCIEESNFDKVKRPKIKNGKMVYDSHLGTWIDWSVVEKYKNYFIDDINLDKKIEYFGVYSTGDFISENSRNYWLTQGWAMHCISEADHLFTKSVWLEELIGVIVDWHKNKVKINVEEGNEFFLQIGKNKICLKLIENKSSLNYVLFLHGLFQNKSGPGFLFTQIANELYGRHNICMFDFPSAGDSDGNSEDLTYELMQEVLQFVVRFILERNVEVKIIAIASGCNNYLLYENRALFHSTILLFPEASQLWHNLQDCEKALSVIDTSDLYDKYVWAEEECCVLGNVLNRSKGINLSVSFLQRLSEFDPHQMLREYDGYAFVNRTEYCLRDSIIYVNDKQGLAMSAQVRDKLISDVFTIMNNITSKGLVNHD